MLSYLTLQICFLVGENKSVPSASTELLIISAKNAELFTLQGDEKDLSEKLF